MFYGVFLGYEFGPGGQWDGIYLVASIDDFTNRSLHASELPSSFWECKSPHKTKVVRLPPEGIKFPLKERYDHDNKSLEVAEASHRHVEREEPPEPALDDDQPKVEEKKSAFDFRPFDPDSAASDKVRSDGGRASATHWIDTQGRAYPIDMYGNIIRRSNKPYGVPAET